jgi:putative AlgH/UPF0301 family transcriptional regulator
LKNWLPICGLVLASNLAFANYFTDASLKTERIANLTKLSPVTGAAATQTDMYLSIQCGGPVSDQHLATALTSEKFIKLVEQMNKRKDVGMHATKNILSGLEKEVGCTK